MGTGTLSGVARPPEKDEDYEYDEIDVLVDNTKVISSRSKSTGPPMYSYESERYVGVDANGYISYIAEYDEDHILKRTVDIDYTGPHAHEWVRVYDKKNRITKVVRKEPDPKKEGHRLETEEDEDRLIERIKQGARNGRYKLPRWLS